MIVRLASRLSNLSKALSLGFAAIALTACSTADGPLEPEHYSGPAKLVPGDANSLNTLKAQISEILGRASFEFGADTPVTSSEFSVLPPGIGPQETHSLALPAVFELLRSDEGCQLRRLDTEEVFTLTGVICMPADED